MERVIQLTSLVDMAEGHRDIRLTLGYIISAPASDTCLCIPPILANEREILPHFFRSCDFSLDSNDCRNCDKRTKYASANI